MKKLATIDFKDYGKTNRVQMRKAARAIVYKDGLLLMIHSRVNGDYKLPGGGQRVFEDILDTLKRETMEETGYTIVDSSVKKLGYIEEIRKSNRGNNMLFKMISYYFKCEVTNNYEPQFLDDYEEEYKYEVCWVNPEYALEKNKELDLKPNDFNWLKREIFILEYLLGR